MKLKAKEKLQIISNLATMLSSGIPILEALDTLLEDSKGNATQVLKTLRESVNAGKPMSDGMAKLPKVFDAVTINIIRAAETAGTLEDALHDLTKTIKKDMAFNDRIRTAMLYPGFIMAVFVGVLLLILLFVIPRISKVFEGLRVDLPLPTQILIHVSNFMLHYSLYMLAGLVVAIVVLIVLFKTQKKAIANFFLGLPLLKPIGRLVDLTRFTRSMGQLLKAGVPVAEALKLSANVVNKREISVLITNMYESVSDGRPISDGLKGADKILPPIMRHILQTAERTGTLEASMLELSEYCDTQVSRTLKNLTALIEPVLIVFIGLLVGGMMLAIIAPIYGIISQISKR